MAGIIDESHEEDYDATLEEEFLGGTSYRRRWVRELQLAADREGPLLKTQQFSTPSGYRLVGINSDRSKGTDGVHSEQYRKEEAWTTTTSTTTTTTTV